MIIKLLVANRGEIAIRAFRGATEMGIATVAVCRYEDRNSPHRLKADESYQIGEMGHPVRAYLSVDEIVRVAKHAGADAVYPGYGFLSENPDLAAACARADITFVGPSAEVLGRRMPSWFEVAVLRFTGQLLEGIIGATAVPRDQ
jgi:pyruvate carboxylase